MLAFHRGAGGGCWVYDCGMERGNAAGGSRAPAAGGKLLRWKIRPRSKSPGMGVPVLMARSQRRNQPGGIDQTTLRSRNNPRPTSYLPLCRPSDTTKQETLKPEGGRGGGWGHPNSALPGPVPAMVPARPLNSSTSSHGLADVHETARLRIGWVRLRYAAAHAATRGRAGACFAHTHRHICIRCTQTVCSTHT